MYRLNKRTKQTRDWTMLALIYALVIVSGLFLCVYVNQTINEEIACTRSTP